MLATYYRPRRGQNLVGASRLDRRRGRARLAARSLPRDPVTLGPAQVSRLVFATPRVSNLLGLRNLEIRDLDKSSIDTVCSGSPHLLFLPGGIVQIQSLYEGSRGPGAARLLGVTAFVNGRAGLGPTSTSAVRQALNKPPQVDVRRPPGRVVVGRPVDARVPGRERAAGGRDDHLRGGQRERVHLRESRPGTGPSRGCRRPPARPGCASTVTGLDGTR